MDSPVLYTQDTTVCNTYRQRWMSRVMLAYMIDTVGHQASLTSELLVPITGLPE